MTIGWPISVEAVWSERPVRPLPPLAPLPTPLLTPPRRAIGPCSTGVESLLGCGAALPYY